MILRKQKLQQGHLIMMVIPSLIIIIAALLLSVSPSTSTAQAKLTSPSISIPHKVQESSPLLTFTTPPLNSSQQAAAQLQRRDETSPSTITRRNLQEVIDPNQLLFFNLAFGFEPGSQREPTLDEMDVLLCKTNEWIQWRIEQKGLELFRNEQTVNVTAYYINWVTLAAPLAGELPLNITFFVHAKYADTHEDVLPSVSFNAFNLVEADVALYITDYVWTLPDSNLFYFTTSVDYKIRKGEDAIPKSSQMAQTTCGEVGETLPPTTPPNLTPLPAAVTTTAPSMAPLGTMATTTVSPTIATTTLVPNIMSPTSPSSTTAPGNPSEGTTTPPPAGGIGGIQIPPGNGIGGINIPPGNANDRTQAPNNDNENGEGPSTAAPAGNNTSQQTLAPIPDTPAPTEAASTSVPATTTTTPLPTTTETADPLPLEENNNNDTVTSMPTAANSNNSNATTTTTPTPLELLPVAFRMEFTWVDPNYTTRQPNKQDVQQVMCTTQLYIQERLQVALAQEYPIRTKITNIQWTNTPDSVNDEEEDDPPEQSTVVLNMTCAAIYQMNESTQEAIPPHLVVAALQGAPEGYLLEYITIGNDDNGGQQDQNLIVDDRHDDIFSHVYELDLQPYAMGTELAPPGNLTSISCGDVMETLPYPADDLLGEPLDLDAIPTTFAGYNGLGTDKDNSTTNNSTATTDAPGSNNNDEDGTNDSDNTGGGGGDGGNSTSNNDGGKDETDNDSNPSTDPMTPATTGQTQQQQQQQPGQQQDVNQKRIDVSFIVSNLDYITIPAEVNRSGLSAAFPVFVETVFTKIANKTASSSQRQRQRQRQRRYLRSQKQPQRQLLDHKFKVSLVPGSAYVESLLKAQCGSNTHPNLVCHEAKAGYDVRLDLVIGRTLQEQTTSNTATADWWEVFLEDTYKGAHDGTLSEILKRETPDTPLFIGTVPPPDDSGGSKSDDVVMWVLIAVIIALAICIFCISWYTFHQRRQHAHDLEEQQRALMGDDGGKHGPDSMHHHHHYPSATEPPSDQQKSTSSDEDKEEFMDEPEDDTDNDGFVDDYTDLDFVGEEAYLELLVEQQSQQKMIDSTGSTGNSRSIGDGGEDSVGDNSETTPVVLHGLSTMSSHHNKSYPDVFEDEPDSDAHYSPDGRIARSIEGDGGSSSSSGGGSSDSSTTSTNSSGDDDDDEDVDWEDFDNTNGTPYVDATATATAATELVGETDLEGSADSEEVDWEDVDGQQPVNQKLDTNPAAPIAAVADNDTGTADKDAHDWRSFDNNDSIEIVFENDSGSGTGSGNGSGSDDVDWEEYEPGLPAAAAAGGGDSGTKAASFLEERAKEKQYFDNANGETSPLGEDDDDEEVEWEEYGIETTDKKDPTAGVKDATNAGPSDDDDDENVNWEEFDTNDKSASAKETENDAADFLKMQDSGSDSDVDWE